MRLIFMGPPGAGKGTQAKLIATRKGVPQISTGEILRQAVAAGTEMGRKAREFMESGGLVPDAVVIGIIEDRLKEADAAAGYILDGFPRTLEQARALDEMVMRMGQKIQCAINIEVAETELVQRLLDRARKEGRSDDTEPVIKKRLQTYREQTEPLIGYYDRAGILKPIVGTGSMAEITDRILAVINGL